MATLPGYHRLDPGPEPQLTLFARDDGDG